MMRDAIAPAWTAIHREGDAKLELATQPMTADLIETTSTHLGAVFSAREPDELQFNANAAMASDMIVGLIHRQMQNKAATVLPPGDTHSL